MSCMKDCTAGAHYVEILITLWYSFSDEIHTSNLCQGGGQSGRSVWGVGDPLGENERQRKDGETNECEIQRQTQTKHN